MIRTSSAMALIAWSLAAATAHAHSFPAKATLLKATLVQSYAECTTPNTQTSAGRPACLSTTETDPSCLFGSKGLGVLSAAISKTNVKLTVKLKGLDPSCEGKTLSPALTVRTTTDDCPNEHCTVEDYDLVGGPCTVKSGKCP